MEWFHLFDILEMAKYSDRKSGKGGGSGEDWLQRSMMGHFGVMKMAYILIVVMVILKLMYVYKNSCEWTFNMGEC